MIAAWVLYGTLNAADLISTEIALRRPNIVESNPIGQNRAVRIAVKAASTVGLAELDKHMKPKHRLIMRIALSVGYSYVVIHNLRTHGN